MVRMVRVSMIWTAEPENWPIVFDTKIDENFCVISSSPISGWIGKPKSEQVRPLLFHANGKGDCGFDAKTDDPNWATDRYFDFNIFEARIRPGEKISYIDKAEDQHDIYIIKSVTDLLTGELL